MDFFTLNRFSLAGIILVMVITIPVMAISNAPSSENVFTSANYWIKIDPIGDHSIGDVFFINGTTNLPLTENLTLYIGGVNRLVQKSSPNPGHRQAIIHDIPIFSIATIPGGIDLWSVNVTDIARNNLIIDDYDVTVISSRENITALTTSSIESQEYGQFHLFPAKNGTTSTLRTPIQSPSPGAAIRTPSTVTLSPTTQSSPLPLLLPILGIAAVGIVFPQFRKKRGL